MNYTYSLPTPEEYNYLRKSSGMGESKNKENKENIQKALQGSLLVISVYDKEKLVGFGRIVGDGGITYGVTDIMVDTNYQRRGIGDQILCLMDEWFEENTDEDSFIMLLANPPADRLYKKHCFQYTYPNKVGMLRSYKEIDKER